MSVSPTFPTRPVDEIGYVRGGDGFPVRYQGATSGALPFFKVSDMNKPGNEVFMSHAKHYISEHQRAQIGATRFPAGAIVFAKVGAAVFLERKRILAQESCIDNNMAALVVNRHVADIRYVHHQLCNFRMSSLVTTTALPSLNNSQLRRVPIRIAPGLLEQRRIAQALSDFDDFLSCLERLIVKNKAVKIGAMQQLLTGQIRLPGFRKPWRTSRLGDVATMNSGGTPPSSISRYYGGGIPWVSISDMTSASKYVRQTERTLSREGLLHSPARPYAPGVVLYAMYASLGECALSVDRVSSSQAILGILPSSKLDSEYLYYELCSRKRQVKELGQQGTQSNLNAGMVRDFMLELPELEEQRAIATALASMDNALDLLKARLAKARSIKQGMMQELLTGRTRLPLRELTAT
jgi:type I restriction enzyme S subunit